MSSETGKSFDIMKFIAGMEKGIGQDWVALVLFMRNLLPRLPGYSKETVAAMQKDVLAEVVKRDFSPAALARACSILSDGLTASMGMAEKEEENRGLKEKLAKMEAVVDGERSAVASLVEEMSMLMVEMKSSCDSTGESITGYRDKAADAAEKGGVGATVVREIKGVFDDMKAQFAEESKVLKDKAASLEKTANFDGLLTNLYNRRALDSHLASCVRKASISGTPLSLMIIDVDHFKAVNDTYGHFSGDMVLHLLSQLLVDHAAGCGGLAARYGGEELVIVMPGVPRRAAIDLAERFRRAVESEDFRMETNGREDHTLSLTVSVGVAAWCEGQGPKDLVVSADAALYRAKTTGRNRVEAA